MEKITESQIKKLKHFYGSHDAVAKELGISPRHYARIRNGQHVTPMVVRLVKFLLEENHKGQGQAA